MSNQSKSRKSLWLGIFAVVVVLTMMLCGCNNEQATPTTTAPIATGGEQEAAAVDLYWNIDRALYDGKSEAGMSSREPGEDGYFHVRFFKDGEIVELRVADRKTVNSMEVQDLMGLEFDEDGVVIGVTSIDDMDIEKLAWQFYVQSVGGKLIKTNSSASMNGMEIMLETDENTGIYDMSGITGEIGKIDAPIQGDRILAIGNEDGQVTHVFVYDRPNYMLTHEAECQHCKKTVTWSEWTKEGELPNLTGHYQLQNDVTLKTQLSMSEDVKLCLDLNGHTIMRNGGRVISLHNAGTELAVMDTSDAQNGKIKCVGNTDQGGCVWLRYGVFYLYSGILDGSEAVTTLNGPTVNMGSNTYFYMYGGELIGGTADMKSNGKGGWSGGAGGNLFIGSNAKFVMNGGVIRNGRAKTRITAYTTAGLPNTYSGGVGGNIYANTGAVIELNGGEILNGIGEQHSGNIYLGGKVELTINSGLISGGKALGRTANGGNMQVSSTAKVVMNGGTIRNGLVYNCGGNVYVNGRFQMNDGLITDGKTRNWTTKKVSDTASNRNVFSVNGDFYMYGGRIAGGFHAVSSTDVTKNPTIVLVSARAVIFDEDGTGPHLSFGNTAAGAKMYVSGTEGLFTNPVDSSYTNYFISEVEGSSVMHTDDGLFLGKAMCACGGKAVGVGDHKCENILWTAWTSDSTLPTTTGNYYLTKNVTGSGVAFKNAGTINIDLNGFDYTQSGGDRAFRVRDDDSKYDSGAFVVTIGLTDSKGGGEIKVTHSGSQDGTVVWLTEATNTFNMYAGILDASGVTTTSGKNGTAVKTLSKSTFNMYGGEIKGGNSPSAGGGAIAIYDTSTFNMYAGKVSGGKTGSSGGNFIVFGNLNVKGGTITGGQAISDTTDDKKGGNISIQSGGTVRISGGTITDGVSDDSGCNIHVPTGAKLYVSGGTISGGYRLRGTTKSYISVTNLFSVNGYVEITGGTINGMACTNTTAAGGTLKISGNPVIGTNPNNEGLYLGYSGEATARAVAELGTLTEGANITVSVSGAFTNVTDQANAKYFTTTVADNSVIYIDDAAALGVAAANEGKLYVGKVMCVCGGKAEGVGDHVCKDVIWTTWTETSMPTASGNYILTKPITTAQKDYSTANTVISLDLNGQTITAATGNNGRVLRLAASGVVFNITDTKGGGQIIGKGHATDQGGVVIMSGQSKLNLFAGTITSDRTHDTPQGGGVLYLTQQGTTVTMYGGEISNGKTTAAGGNIWVNSKATFIMHAGKVVGGTARADGYDNIHCKMSNVEFYGGEIDGGVMVQNWNKDASTIKIAGNPVIYKEGATHNLNLIWSTGDSSPANYPVIQLGKLEAGAKIDVTVDGNRVVAAPNGSYVITDTDAGYFTADSCGRKVVLKDGKLETAAP